MAVNTLPRDYDIARIIDDYERRIAFLERQALLNPVALSIWRDAPGGFDTGWQLITNFEASYDPLGGGNTPMIRRYGPLVHIKGRCEPNVNIVASGSIFTVPSGFGFEPSGVIHEGGRSLVPGASNGAHRYFITVAGVGSQQGFGSGVTVNAGTDLSMTTTWMVELP